MRVPDEVAQCVVYIGVEIARNRRRKVKISLLGTGFFVCEQTADGRQFPYVVTAQHVLENAPPGQLWIRMNRKEGGTFCYPCEPSQWIFHPDEKTDVAVLPWTVPDEIEAQHIPDSMLLEAADLRAKNIGLGDEVFVTGIFGHFVGNGRNHPIVRTGNIAMMPTEPIPTTRGMMDAYLIESRSLGGISGSPVFVRETLCNPLTGHLRAGAMQCLGLVHGHWVTPRGAGQEPLGIGVSIVVPASKIRECFRDPRLQEARAAGEVSAVAAVLTTIPLIVPM